LGFHAAVTAWRPGELRWSRPCSQGTRAGDAAGALSGKRRDGQQIATLTLPATTMKTLPGSAGTVRRRDDTGDIA